MIAKGIQSRKDLPENYEDLNAFSWELILQFKSLQEKYQKLLKKTFGKSSEKLSDQTELDGIQMEMDFLFDQLFDTSEKDEKTEYETVTYKRRKNRSGRNSVPEEMIEDVYVDIPDEEKICDICNKEKSIINKKEHLVIERKPAEYTAKNYIRPVYACSCCKDSTTAADPIVTPIKKSLAGPCLLVFVILSKYLYHLPLYRIQRQIFHESTIWFTRSTLSNWVGNVSFIFERIYKILLQEYQRSRIKHSDETPFQVRSGFKDAEFFKGYMWVGITGDERIAVFHYSRYRNTKTAIEFLSGSSPGDYLMTDDCPSYDGAVKELGLINIHCLIHIRRKFIEARDAKYQLSYVSLILRKIGQIYRIEKYAKAKKLSAEERGKLRKIYSTGILAQIKIHLEKPGFEILPETLVGKAIKHFLKNWDKATHFSTDGRLPVDNQVNERAIRPFTIGRNNWLYAGSENGAKWMAIIYTIISTCKLNNIDPHDYLVDVIMRLAIRPDNANVSDLTPIEWLKHKNGGTLPEQKPLYPKD